MTHIARGGPSRVAEAAASMRPGAMRYFLFVLSLYYVVVAIVGFTPSYIDFVKGETSIDPIVHVHGVLMASWLGIFITQTWLAADGSIARHRALGLTATGLAALVWISMCVMTVHALQKANFPQDDFLVDVLLVQLYTIILFPVFFIWGFLARGNPAASRGLGTNSERQSRRFARRPIELPTLGP